ncbi:MAG: helix-turn-helix domain-containing protein [Hyphomicrobiaceae bacterium]
MDHIAGRLNEIARNIEVVSADPVTRHGFTQVPNFLFKGSGLSIGAIVVYAKFLSYAWHNDYCFPGQEQLAADIGVTDRSVRTWVKELQTAGLLEVEQRGLGKTNLYRLHFRVAGRSGDNSGPDRKNFPVWNGTDFRSGAEKCSGHSI